MEHSISSKNYNGREHLIDNVLVFIVCLITLKMLLRKKNYVDENVVTCIMYMPFDILGYGCSN